MVFGPDNRYYLAKALEDLTRPGEWVLDRAEGRIYEALIGFQRGHHLERNVFWTTKERPVLYTIHRYEEPLLHLCDRNLIWGRDPYRIPWSQREAPSSFVEIDVEAWRAQGHDRESVFADPGFVDPGHDDFRLRSDSPLHALGFVPIPWERIGPRRRAGGV